MSIVDAVEGGQGEWEPDCSGAGRTGRRLTHRLSHNDTLVQSSKETLTQGHKETLAQQGGERRWRRGGGEGGAGTDRCGMGWTGSLVPTIPANEKL